MHEEALYADLRRKLVEISRDADGAPILRVRLRLGALGHVDEAAVRDRWPALVAGSPAEGSRLEVERSSDPSAPEAGGVLLVEVGLGPPPAPP